MKNILALLLALICSTAQAAAPVIPAFADMASRITCASPCAVFFDASGTTGNVTRSFHDLDYSWNLGDAAAGTRTTGSNTALSKNLGKGPFAAYVYENAGTYTVSLTVTDGSLTSSRTGTVTVASAASTWDDAHTFCYAQDADAATGCPSATGANQIANVTDLATSIAAHIADNTRHLLKRGNSFNAGVVILTKSVGMIGAYGTGAKPKVTGTDANYIFKISSTPTPSMHDWRFVDLEVTSSASTSAAFYFLGGASQITVLRVDAHDVHNGVLMSEGIMEILNNSVHFSVPPWDQIAVVDSTLTSIVGGSGGYGIYAYATKFAAVGNLIGNTTAAEHSFRAPYLSKALLEANTLGPSATSKMALTIRAQDFAGTNTLPAGTYTQQVVVADNKFIGGSGDFISANGTSTGATEELQRDEIWERNWFAYASGVQMGVDFSGASLISIRNNIFNMTGALAHGGISLDFNDGVSLQTPCDLVWIYNNTFYSADTDNDFRAVWLSQALKATNVTVKNNLAYAPNDSTHLLIFDGTAGPTTNLVQSNNSSSAQVAGTSPVFTGTTNPIDFRPAVSGYGVDGGTPVFPASSSDFFNCANNAAKKRMGAFEPFAQAQCSGVAGP